MPYFVRHSVSENITILKLVVENCCFQHEKLAIAFTVENVHDTVTADVIFDVL